MSRPGDRLRAMAARVFDAVTMERLIDPVIAVCRWEAPMGELQHRTEDDRRTLGRTDSPWRSLSC